MTSPFVILSGPSGVGKSVLVTAAVDAGWTFVPPFTTRKPRTGEVPDVDYCFVSVGQFQDKIRRAELVGWDFALGHYYGSGNELRHAVATGKPLILHALARLALRLREAFPQTRLVFLDASDDEVLEHRLRARGASGADLVARRLHWQEERTHAPLFDEVLDAAELNTGAQQALIDRLWRDTQR